MRRWLLSLLFLAGGLATEVTQPLGPFCPVPASTPDPRRPRRS